jgi:hypothetical protein
MPAACRVPRAACGNDPAEQPREFEQAKVELE